MQMPEALAVIREFLAACGDGKLKAAVCLLRERRAFLESELASKSSRLRKAEADRKSLHLRVQSLTRRLEEAGKDRQS